MIAPAHIASIDDRLRFYRPATPVVSLLAISLLAALVLLTRQTQLRDYNIILSMSTLLTAVLGVRRALTPRVLAALFYLSASASYALLTGVTVTDMGRFLAILAFTLLAFGVASPLSMAWLRLFILIAVVQAVGVIAVGGYLSLTDDRFVALFLRAWVLTRNLGDIYILPGSIIYRVQIVGNALLPFFFFLTLHLRAESKLALFTVPIFAVSLIFAGNLTYWLVAALYVIYNFRLKLVEFLVILWAPAMAVAVVGGVYLVSALSLKAVGDDGSLGVRLEQFSLVWNSFSAEPIRLLFGVGLGARLPGGRFTDYSQYQYIELQTIYIIYQIGLIGMMIYSVAFIDLARRYIDPRYISVLVGYIAASATNPYIFDSNQVFTTAVLVALSVNRERSNDNVSDLRRHNELPASARSMGAM